VVAQCNDEAAKQRMKMNMRLLNQGVPPRPSTGPGGRKLKEDKPTYKEKFVPPNVSMISYFMTKVRDLLIVPSLHSISVL
jgi:hypothetical protein